MKENKNNEVVKYILENYDIYFRKQSKIARF